MGDYSELLELELKKAKLSEKKNYYNLLLEEGKHETKVKKPLCGEKEEVYCHEYYASKYDKIKAH